MVWYSLSGFNLIGMVIVAPIARGVVLANQICTLDLEERGVESAPDLVVDDVLSRLQEFLD